MEAFKVLRYMMFKDLLTYCAVKYIGISFLVVCIVVDEDIVKQDFDVAWLHHQNCNPHHWQYWILRRDEGKEAVIDMPVKYIIEMLCDRHSFSRKDNNSTAYKWYYSNIDKIKISENTRKIVEKYIGFFKIPLK